MAHPPSTCSTNSTLTTEDSEKQTKRTWSEEQNWFMTTLWSSDWRCTSEETGGNRRQKQCTALKPCNRTNISNLTLDEKVLVRDGYIITFTNLTLFISFSRRAKPPRTMLLRLKFFPGVVVWVPSRMASNALIVCHCRTSFCKALGVKDTNYMYCLAGYDATTTMNSST